MFQWDDLRHFLAIARTGNTSKAARQLGVNQSTVSRRLRALEDDLSLKLFSRKQHGLEMTEDGKLLKAKAERMEELAFELQRELCTARDRVEGIVRVTTVEDIASVILAPHFKDFRRRYPNIQLQLVTGMRNFDLARGEADVALRLARPTEGDLVARMVGSFGFAVYSSKSYLDSLTEEQLRNPKKMDWLVIDAGIRGMADNWYKTHFGDVTPIMRTSSFKPLIAAVNAGLGVALLPRPYRFFYDELVRVPIDTSSLRREIWLVVHKDMRKVRAVNAVMSFLEEVMRKPLEPTTSL